MNAIPQLTPYECASLLYSALQVIGTMEAACINERPFSAPLPRGILSCGEAVTLIPALIVLIGNHYPNLLDPEYLAEQMAVATTMMASGEPN